MDSIGIVKQKMKFFRQPCKKIFDPKKSLTIRNLFVYAIAMETNRCKAKIKQLVNSQKGPKKERYKAVGAMLHISPRYVEYLLAGAKKPSFHLALLIDELTEAEK